MIENRIKSRYRELLRINDEQCSKIKELSEIIAKALQTGHKVYTFGNGGSAAEAQHFTTELIGRFKDNRKPLPAVCLSVDATALTCIGNDYGFEYIFSRQVQGLVEQGDVVIGFSTSGASQNVINGMLAVHEKDATSVLFTGSSPNPKAIAQIRIEVGGSETAIIQELHLVLIHILCELIEEELGFNNGLNKNRQPKIIYEKDLRTIQLPPRESIVWVNGCFDLLHEGHLFLLNSASTQATFLVVGLNSDTSVRKIKGEGRPIVSEMNRARTLSQLPFVDLVIIFKDENPKKILNELRPGFVLKDEIYEEVEYPEKELLQLMNAKILYTRHLKEISTSKMIENMK